MVGISYIGPTGHSGNIVGPIRNDKPAWDEANSRHASARFGRIESGGYAALSDLTTETFTR